VCPTSGAPFSQIGQSVRPGCGAKYCGKGYANEIFSLIEPPMQTGKCCLGAGILSTPDERAEIVLIAKWAARLDRAMNSLLVEMVYGPAAKATNLALAQQSIG
jgi:hypothetical protein